MANLKQLESLGRSPQEGLSALGWPVGLMGRVVFITVTAVGIASTTFPLAGGPGLCNRGDSNLSPSKQAGGTLSLAAMSLPP